jgi:hypothetical protein
LKISSTGYIGLFIGLLLFSLFQYSSSLSQEQAQQQFQSYHDPDLGISLQYSPDWQLVQESKDKLNFVKQQGFVTVDLNANNLDPSGITLSEYSNRRVTELQSQRTDFRLISFEPIIISDDKPAQKVVYSFTREEDNKTNKVMRIWSINENKLFTLAYIAESTQYDRYLPTFQKMVDSFHFDITGESADPDQSRNNSNGDNGAKPPPSNGTDLTINIKIAHDPIVRGNEQSITVTVSESDSGDKISGAEVTGYVRYVTGHREIISGATDQNGVYKHSWPISGNAKIGTFMVHVDVSADGNMTGSKEKSFQVIAKIPASTATSNINRTLNQTDPTGQYECTEDGLSYGSYYDENGLIVGSPCDPEEYCSDKGSTNPAVIDYCEDIWGDIDECIINPSICDDEGNVLPVPPLCDENTPPGTTCRDEGDPDDCEPGFVDRGFGCEPEECPEGQVGTPPNCEPPPEGGGDEGGGDEGGGDEGGGDEGGNGGDGGDGGDIPSSLFG